MVQKISKEETRILDSIEKLPFADEDKNVWREIIQNSGVNEEMVKDILSRLTGFVASEGEEALVLARNTTELRRNVQSWRLTQNLRNLGGRKRRR